ncbi:MAG: pantoate--beta-alanine ligase [Thermoanaerobaculia bacterium]|jgi:pantoate--beta-alanine ligase|nr:pantoate--beta-alanine ligase [Thermoanaerobaculia bacterium]
MKRIETAPDLRSAVASYREKGQRVAFVPTMGALHAGHLALVEQARRAAGKVVVSIFVNPKQFGPGEDFERYPRDLEADAEKLREAGADLLFAPTVDVMYPPGFSTTVHVAGVSEGMEGARRPGHFDGVATVVARLLGLVLPDVAVFGQKDAQQCAVVMRLVADLGLPVEVLVAPTVRESDGLAMSSRNSYLSPEERKAAPALFRALLATQLVHELGERKAEKLLAAFRMAIGAEPRLDLDSVDLVDAATMRPVEKVDRPVLLAAAVRAGRTRLIDNVVFGG